MREATRNVVYDVTGYTVPYHLGSWAFVEQSIPIMGAAAAALMRCLGWSFVLGYYLVPLVVH